VQEGAIVASCKAISLTRYLIVVLLCNGRALTQVVQRSSQLQLVLHIRHDLPQGVKNWIWIKHLFFLLKKVELVGRVFDRGGIVWIWVEQIVLHRLDMGIVLGI